MIQYIVTITEHNDGRLAIAMNTPKSEATPAEGECGASFVQALKDWYQKRQEELEAKAPKEEDPAKN